MTERRASPKALTATEFAQAVGFAWRSLRPLALEHGLGMRLNNRWGFTNAVSYTHLTLPTIYSV